MAGGLADRKRPFSLLRLTGARLAMLRRVIALESAVPLLAVAAVAIGIGFAASAMYATTEMHLSLVSPGAAYYVLTSAGIVLALGHHRWPRSRCCGASPARRPPEANDPRSRRPQICRSRPAQYGARRVRLSTFPLGVRGSASTMSTVRGHL